MDFSDYILPIAVFITIVVILPLCLLYSFAIICEIPHWIRGWRLSRLAKKHNLSFIRAKKGWYNGWLSLRASEKNIINGSINGMTISFSDLMLIGGSLFLGDKPSIAVQGTSNDVNRISGKGIARRVTRLNGRVYYFLGTRLISSLFKNIANGTITSENELYDALKAKDFSKHVFKDYRNAAFITSFVFMLLIWIGATVFPIHFTQVFGVILLICLLVFIIVAKKMGKRFTPEELDKYPGQDQYF